MSENQEPPIAGIKIKVDRSPEVLAERAEKEQAQKELAELKQKDLERRRSFLPFRLQALANMDSISSLEELAENEKNEFVAKGSVPLNKTIGGEYINPKDDPKYETKRSFDSYGEMIKYLHSEEKTNPDAHEILNRLTARTLNDMSENSTCYSLDSSIADFLTGKGKFKIKRQSDSHQEDLELAS
jgi:chromatin segregation and condensation protein Rec8/ScpA/Scc1 (kleisin family)